jgi:hypothetical protein
MISAKVPAGITPAATLGSCIAMLLLFLAKIKLAFLTRKGKIETQFLPGRLIFWQPSEKNDEKIH